MGLRDLLDQRVPMARPSGVSNPKIEPLPGVELGPLSRGDRRRDVALAGTSQILTPDGLRPAMGLRAGDLVETLDHGVQPLAWVGRSAPAYQLSDDTNGPIRIRAGAFGAFGPQENLTVFADQRILIDCPKCEALFGHRQYFVAARHLLHLRGVRRLGESDGPSVNLMFGTSAIVQANGAWVEAWRPESLAIKGLSKALWDDLLASDPCVAHAARLARYQAARPNLDAKEARRLVR